MRKKGISPLIATVILIGLVFVIGVTLSSFIRNFSEKQTESIEFNTNLDRLCIEDTRLEMSNICKGTSPNTFEIIMENKGPHPVKDITFIISSNTSSEVSNKSNNIEKFGRRKYDVAAPTYSSGETIEIIYIKNIEVDNITGSCDAAKLKIESDSILGC